MDNQRRTENGCFLPSLLLNTKVRFRTVGTLLEKVVGFSKPSDGLAGTVSWGEEIRRVSATRSWVCVCLSGAPPRIVPARAHSPTIQMILIYAPVAPRLGPADPVAPPDRCYLSLASRTHTRSRPAAPSDAHRCLNLCLFSIFWASGEIVRCCGFLIFVIVVVPKLLLAFLKLISKFFLRYNQFEISNWNLYLY